MSLEAKVASQYQEISSPICNRELLCPIDFINLLNYLTINGFYVRYGIHTDTPQVLAYFKDSAEYHFKLSII